MRLIDADAIKIPKGFFEKVDNVPKFYDWLDDQPTIEAEPVKHGRWEEKTVNNCRIDEWQSTRCSACGRYHTTPYLYYFTDYQYCPCCGAQMDLKEEAETEDEP